MLTFRRATTDDVDALVPLVESAYRGEASRAGWTTEADLLDGQRTDPAGVAEVITAPKSAVLVAEQDGAVVACCHVAEVDGAGYFGMFAVDPTRQAGGIGRLTLAEAERHVREDWGLPEMRMKVLTARADLIAWYVRRGYDRTGLLIPFPYGDDRFGQPRRTDLAFELLTKRLG
ncbi:GNAT family N-acetyltransferase [Actinokineospora globicatena]|uniref:N-acetyltransferase n=1 Tax=Actinokineospora globicatena TaxID=103729 RepID=A0A9W6QSI9_9PSEU|nr:GNAT family N-acetyltransferase [Actinokineospora globicatena]MCP2302233.1 Ribosomal protein S18 acetylase RimI [Actinokineospora globicatena]GLW76103.1 N-acetyltransferase [Actinokineospora globicatena]GLW82938.1 N-acetyltransferase [Actinokineospora globicatena]GLW95768.1 N-acetyltransferase [Actinokineospora globicatena]